MGRRDRANTLRRRLIIEQHVSTAVHLQIDESRGEPCTFRQDLEGDRPRHVCPRHNLRGRYFARARILPPTTPPANRRSPRWKPRDSLSSFVRRMRRRANTSIKKFAALKSYVVPTVSFPSLSAGSLANWSTSAFHRPCASKSGRTVCLPGSKRRSRLPLTPERKGTAKRSPNRRWRRRSWE